MLDSMSNGRDSVDRVRHSMDLELDPRAADLGLMKAAHEPVTAAPSAMSAALDFMDAASRLAATSRASESESGRIESPNQGLENVTRCSLLADHDFECRTGRTE
jgi:hypothetical protein